MLTAVASALFVVIGLHQALRPGWAIETGRQTAPIGVHPAVVPLSRGRYRAVVRYGGVAIAVAGAVGVYWSVTGYI